ncbi:MAG: decarboxylating 6-phosphogluconate dehydrogenase [Thermodesulfovibrionales bacterium]
MQIGMVGIGKMGLSMALRLRKGGHSVVVHDASPDRVRETVQGQRGMKGAYSLEDMASLLRPPRVVWLMIPAGKPVEETIGSLQDLLEEGDLLVDGGNSFYKDDLHHAEQLGKRGISYMDVGVSGGIWGLKEGYCLMAGGEKADFKRIEPLLKTLAPKDGYLYCGPVGAGHFVKMVHNGIEYGMMAAYGEGFQLLYASPYTESLDLGGIAHLWNQGSVVRSWLLELCESAFRKDRDLSRIGGYVEDSGEGRWTVQQAVEMGVPAPLTALSLFGRFRSREKEPFSDKLQAALRREFGGHEVVAEEKKRPRGGRPKGKRGGKRGDGRGREHAASLPRTPR